MEPEQFIELMEAIEIIQGRLDNFTAVINNQHNLVKILIDQQSHLIRDCKMNCVS